MHLFALCSDIEKKNITTNFFRLIHYIEIRFRFAFRFFVLFLLFYFHNLINKLFQLIEAAVMCQMCNFLFEYTSSLVSHFVHRNYHAALRIVCLYLGRILFCDKICLIFVSIHYSRRFFVLLLLFPVYVRLLCDSMWCTVN